MPSVRTAQLAEHDFMIGSSGQRDVDRPFEEAEKLHTSIPHLRFLRQTSVPSWAVEEPDVADGEDGGEPDSTENGIPRLIPIDRYVTRGTYERGDDAPSEDDDDIAAAERTVAASTFNEQGYITQEERFETETLTQRDRFTYDGEMRLVRKVTEDLVNENSQTEERFYNSDGKIEQRVITYSDGSQIVTQHRWSGNEEEEVTRSDEGIESHKRRKYDSEGRVIERLEINPETNETTGGFAVYNVKGQLVEVGVVEADGTRWVSERTTYNDDGTEDTALTLDAEGNEVERRVSTYENGDCVQQVVTDADGETHTDSTFDAAHHVIRVRATGPGIEEDAIYEYSERGLMSASARRSMVDRGHQERRGLARVTAETRTTWWEWEFYE
jgi:hypothetical protein